MSADETIHVSETGGRKAGNLERYDLIPTEPLRLLAKHYGVGSLKYDDDNWQKGYDWRLSYAALQRHVNQFWAGEDIDAETGSPHPIAAAWHCFTLTWFMANRPEFDTRTRTKVSGLSVDRERELDFNIRVHDTDEALAEFRRRADQLAGAVPYCTPGGWVLYPTAPSREAIIYISGPISGMPEFNHPAFNAAAAGLRTAGWKVINPVELDDGDTSREWHYYLRRDLAELTKATHIYMLPGWPNSRGASLEFDVAQRLGMTVIYHPKAEKEYDQ